MRKHLAQWPLFPVQPELISIHLPKTAGSSFHAALNFVYGWRLKHLFRSADWIAFEQPQVFRCAKPGVRAVHGHLHHLQPEWKKLYPNAQWVTWLRDPAERVVSAYFHWQKPVNHQDLYHTVFLAQKPSLLDFAADPTFRPVTHVYQQILGSVNPQDFLFIGRTEHYAKDLITLTNLMHWPEIPNFQKNRNPSKPPIAAADWATIRASLKQEYEVYHHFLAYHFPRSL